MKKLCLQVAGMIIGWIFIVLLMVSTVVAGNSISNIIPANTSLVVRADIKKLRETSLYKDIKQKNLIGFKLFRSTILIMKGLDIENVEEAWLIGEKRKKGFIILRGNFDVRRIINTVNMSCGSDVVKIAGTRLAVLLNDKKRKKKNLAVILDDSTISIGDIESVKEFVSTFNNQGQRISPEKQSIVDSVCDGNDIAQFVILRIDPDIKNRFPISEIIKRSDGKLDIRNDMLNFMTRLYTADSKYADAIAKILSGAITIALSPYTRIKCEPAKQNKIKILKNILASVKIDTNIKVVNINGQISSSDIQKLIRTEKQIKK